MTRILAVDDSRAIRSMVTRQIAELGIEFDEAEDGLQGLEKLSEISYDLVVLDVTMPELDGVGMLTKMREKGDNTPVLMLTSESKTSIISALMKLNIEDYILKPFKPEDLRAKLNKVLKLAPAAPAPVRAQAPDTARKFFDVLVVDDMDNVQKKLRALLPQHTTMNSSLSAQHSLTLCKEGTYRLIVVDVDLPDVRIETFLSQIRAVQPSAVILALYLKSTADPTGGARALGFDGVLLKPFDAAAIEEMLQLYFERQDILETVDNVLRVLPFSGKEDRHERYFSRLKSLATDSIPKFAEACFDGIVVDLREVPLDSQRLPYFVAAIEARSKKEGLGLALVGTGDLKKVLSGFAETAAVPLFDTMEAARAAV